MTTRAELLVPEGWAPRRGSTVAVLPTTERPAPPPGRWKVFDAADLPGHWWLLPLCVNARSWAASHPAQVESMCLKAPGRTLVPPGYTPRPPERKGR